MDLKQLWLNTRDLWGALDQHPLVLSGLALMVLLGIALLLGRVAFALMKNQSEYQPNRPLQGYPAT
ncbi:hypothetical protein HK44_009940 [Pseudomonas fluorescens HK44]|uniref:Uncharacterized protein n=1 Tax=Pseudomonas fluorescens HK44 TaxID=1042209 RepID=A0A010TA08_PSEFL|nr:hypothetical protein HK44_009940 [Pseudomonas fluorescens HK44]